MTQDQIIKPLKHQELFLYFVEKNIDIRYFWFVGGYRSGKSFTICLLILYLAEKYKDQEVVIGLGAPTISLMKKTFILDLEILLTKTGIAYTFNHTNNILFLNGVQFILISTAFPTDIYGYTFNAFLCDELDELNQYYGQEAFTAIDERCSKPFPDGRKPFLAFFSTAQGYKTIYAKHRELKEKKIPQVLVRGRTKDNTHNDPSYYENRYALYNENERKAFLEGYFVNLQQGMVYPSFDESTMVIDDIQIGPENIVNIGQDLNSGFSKAVCIIKKNGILYAIRTFSFKEIGQAPTIIRNNFMENDIFWYPDASGKEIMAGYAMEIRNAGINLRTAPTNPSILERIFILNKLFKSNKLIICKSCNDLIIALKTRSFDKNGAPEKGKGETAPDHICDAFEYVLWRIVMADNDFKDLRSLTKQAKLNGE